MGLHTMIMVIILAAMVETTATAAMMAVESTMYDGDHGCGVNDDDTSYLAKEL